MCSGVDWQDQRDESIPIPVGGEGVRQVVAARVRKKETQRLLPGKTSWDEGPAGGTERSSVRQTDWCWFRRPANVTEDVHHVGCCVPSWGTVLAEVGPVDQGWLGETVTSLGVRTDFSVFHSWSHRKVSWKLFSNPSVWASGSTFVDTAWCNSPGDSKAQLKLGSAERG